MDGSSLEASSLGALDLSGSSSCSSPVGDFVCFFDGLALLPPPGCSRVPVVGLRAAVRPT